MTIKYSTILYIIYLYGYTYIPFDNKRDNFLEI